MKAIVCCMMNFFYSFYLFYVAFTMKVKRNSFASDEKLTTGRLFICFAFVALFNCLFILLSIFHLEKFAYPFGVIMIFSNGLASTCLASDFMVSVRCKNPTVVALFNLVSISIACFVSFMAMDNVSFSPELGYSVVASKVLGGRLWNISWLEIYYSIFALIYPICTFISALVKVIKEKDYPDRMFMSYLVAAIGGAFAYLLALLIIAYEDRKVDIYNTLYPFTFVIFAIVLWFCLQSESLTKSFVLYIVKSFIIVIMLNGIIFSTAYMFSIDIQSGLPRYLYFVFILILLWALLCGGWYTSKGLYGIYAEHEEFKKIGYRISEENKLLQYLQYYTENITDPKFSVDYNIGTKTKTSDDILDFIQLSPSKYFIVFGRIKENTPNIRRNMLILKSVYRTILQNCKNMQGFVQKVNEYIFKNIPPNAGISMFIAEMDLVNDNLSFVNCNMNCIVHCSSASGKTEKLNQASLCLGQKSDLDDLEINTVHFVKDDRFYVGSDDNIDVTANCIVTENSNLEMRYR